MAKTKTNPQVSIIIPTYNRAHLVGRAIQSVLDQTYNDFEIIVVDDGSTDNTEKVVNSFNDERIRYIHCKENKGAAASRNIGIKAAKNEYVAFQDSDDEWLPEKLEKQMKVFDNASPNVGVVYTGFWRIEGDRKTYTPSPQISQKEGNIYSSLLRGNFVTTQAAVVKRECFTKAGMFDKDLPRLQDWELWIRISRYYSFKCIDEPLVISYYQPDSISADQNAIIKACKLISEKHFGDIKKNRKLLADHYFGIGSLLRSDEATKQARNYLIKAVMAYPLNTNFLLLAFISLFPQGAYNKVAKSYRKIQGWWSRE